MTNGNEKCDKINTGTFVFICFCAVVFLLLAIGVDAGYRAQIRMLRKSNAIVQDKEADAFWYIHAQLKYEQSPALRTLIAKCMEDGKLTESEVKSIIEAQKDLERENLKKMIQK